MYLGNFIQHIFTPSPPPPRSVPTLLLSIPTSYPLFLISYRLPICAGHVLLHIVTQWSMVHVSGATPSKKTDSFSRSHQLAVVFQLGVRAYESLPTLCLNVDWLDLIQVQCNTQTYVTQFHPLLHMKRFYPFFGSIFHHVYIPYFSFVHLPVNGHLEVVTIFGYYEQICYCWHLLIHLLQLFSLSVF